MLMAVGSSIMRRASKRIVLQELTDMTKQSIHAFHALLGDFVRILKDAAWKAAVNAQQGPTTDSMEAPPFWIVFVALQGHLQMKQALKPAFVSPQILAQKPSCHHQLMPRKEIQYPTSDSGSFLPWEGWSTSKAIQN
jgi:hypothetical protein